MPSWVTLWTYRVCWPPRVGAIITVAFPAASAGTAPDGPPSSIRHANDAVPATVARKSNAPGTPTL